MGRSVFVMFEDDESPCDDVLDMPFILEVGGKDRPRSRPNVDDRQWVDRRGRSTVDHVCPLHGPWPFPDRSFSYLMSSFALERIPWDNLLDFAREVYRVLKPGGRVCVSTRDFHQVLRNLTSLHWTPDANHAVYGKDRRCGLTPAVVHSLFTQSGFADVQVVVGGRDGTTVVADAFRPLSGDVSVCRYKLGNQTLCMMGEDDCMLSSLLVHKGRDPLECRVYREHLKQGDTFLEVGAHVGVYTTLMAEIVGAAGRGHAFEPDTLNRMMLTRNLRDNGFPNVTVYPYAASDSRGETKLYREVINTGDCRLWQDGGDHRLPVTVPFVPVDDCVSGRVDFAKIDTQGCEVRVLRGMQRLLRDNPLITLMVEFWPRGLKGAGSDVRELASLLEHFKIYDLDEKKNEIVPVADLTSLVPDDSDHFTNLLCVRA